jgi:hypothetical protein
VLLADNYHRADFGHVQDKIGPYSGCEELGRRIAANFQTVARQVHPTSEAHSDRCAYVLVAQYFRHLSGTAHEADEKLRRSVFSLPGHVCFTDPSSLCAFRKPDEPLPYGLRANKSK